MADLIKLNSTRLNMFNPTDEYSKIVGKVNTLLDNINNGNSKFCDILIERIARRAAGSIFMYKQIYNLSLTEVEELLDLSDLRKAFACKNVDLLKLINAFETDDNLLSNETLEVLTTSDNHIIIINI